MQVSPILIASNLQKSYTTQNGSSKLQVLNGLDLSVQRGSITSIIGTSGSGKSTLLHILGGLDKPDSGSVLWDDTDIFALNKNQLAEFRNKYMGFVFQFHHLLPEFTSLENVCMPALISGTRQEKARERALYIMNRLGVAERAAHRPAQLSGGEQQRVAIARALMNNPKVILADEPTGNLDEKNTDTILGLLSELRDEFEVTILLITHERKVSEFSDITLEINNGTIS